jgi:tetratricopeptide (TPR) repeat protein
MQAAVKTCPTCGEKISPTIGECLYCPPVTESAPTPEPEPAPVPAAAPVPSSAPPPPDPERAFGLLLFEAEESLARGHVEKALVHASRAMRERPGSLTARSLFERARKEATRGRRREKLDARLAEAKRLFEAQDFAAAEKIVGAALKVVPDDAMALELFRRLKERRLAGPSAEAEAERELDRQTRERARRSAEAARAALAAGAEFRALLTVRRALRLVPDAPELLAVLAEVQKSLQNVPAGAELAPASGSTPAPRPEERAMAAQVEMARDLARKGRLDDSLKLLRAVLYEDIDFAPAQAAVQEVRRTWLAQHPAPPRPAVPEAVPVKAVPPPEAVKPIAAKSTVPTPAPVTKAAAPRPAGSGVHRRPVVPGPPPGATPRPIARPAAVSAGPDALRLPARPHRTPWPLVIGCAGAVAAGILYLGRSEKPAARPAAPVTMAAATPTAPASPVVEPEPPGPLRNVDPELRRAIQETLAAYGRAIERVDPEALALARPDLTADQRALILERFRGALNVATDLRVLDVTASGDGFVVPVLRTDVVVGGRGDAGPPVEETLRFDRSGAGWVLRARR